MNRLVFGLPAIGLMIVAALWLANIRRGGSALREAIATQRAALSPSAPPDPGTIAAAEANAAAIAHGNEESRAELSRIEGETAAARQEIAALQAKMPAAAGDEQLESYGRLADMGREIGEFLRLSSGGKPPGEDGDGPRDMTELMMKLVTWAPEVSGFEETPAEIAAFQAAMLRETYALSETQARQAEAIIQAHYAMMKTAGLTYASRETDGWRERRSASLTQLLWQLRPFVPANPKQAALLGSIVNVGSGLETRTETKLSPEPGKSQINVSMHLPTWPSVPWLTEGK